MCSPCWLPGGHHAIPGGGAGLGRIDLSCSEQHGAATTSAASEPFELECDVKTANGAAMHFRPIRPEDATRLVDFHRHLSAHSVYRRDSFMHPTLSAAEIERFTHVDCIDRLALIVEDGDEFGAVGRYDRGAGPTEAEVAFLVADEYEHQGIGTLILEHLADAGLEQRRHRLCRSDLGGEPRHDGCLPSLGVQGYFHF